jgi:hypothetical protein
MVVYFDGRFPLENKTFFFKLFGSSDKKKVGTILQKGEK